MSSGQLAHTAGPGLQSRPRHGQGDDPVHQRSDEPPKATDTVMDPAFAAPYMRRPPGPSHSSSGSSSGYHSLLARKFGFGTDNATAASPGADVSPPAWTPTSPAKEVPRSSAPATTSRPATAEGDKKRLEDAETLLSFGRSPARTTSDSPDPSNGPHDAGAGRQKGKSQAGSIASIVDDVPLSAALPPSSRASSSTGGAVPLSPPTLPSSRRPSSTYHLPRHPPDSPRGPRQSTSTSWQSHEPSPPAVVAGPTKGLRLPSVSQMLAGAEGAAAARGMAVETSPTDVGRRMSIVSGASAGEQPPQTTRGPLVESAPRRASHVGPSFRSSWPTTSPTSRRASEAVEPATLSPPVMAPYSQPVPPTFPPPPPFHYSPPSMTSTTTTLHPPIHPPFYPVASSCQNPYTCDVVPGTTHVVIASHSHLPHDLPPSHRHRLGQPASHPPPPPPSTVPSSAAQTIQIPTPLVQPPRPRVSLACKFCRLRKLRCTQAPGPCDHCVRRGKECVFESTRTAKASVGSKANGLRATQDHDGVERDDPQARRYHPF